MFHLHIPKRSQGFGFHFLVFVNKGDTPFREEVPKPDYFYTFPLPSGFIILWLKRNIISKLVSSQELQFFNESLQQLKIAQLKFNESGECVDKVKYSSAFA